MNRHTPERFFSRSDKALLRFAFANLAATDEEWIELPGPAAWWPDVTGRRKDTADDKKALDWYLKNGFDILDDDVQGYLDAAEAIRQKEPPKDWVKNLVHEDDELIWEQFRD